MAEKLSAYHQSAFSMQDTQKYYFSQVPINYFENKRRNFSIKILECDNKESKFRIFRI